MTTKKEKKGWIWGIIALICLPFVLLYSVFRDVFDSSKNIGNLNGKWAVSFKALLAVGGLLAPFFVSWMIWMSSTAYAASHHIEATADLADRIDQCERQVEREEILITQLEKLITHLDSDYDNLSKDIKQNDATNTAQHQTILVELGKTQTKLDLLQDLMSKSVARRGGTDATFVSNRKAPN
jgi:hypothetical protein